MPKDSNGLLRRRIYIFLKAHPGTVPPWISIILTLHSELPVVTKGKSCTEDSVRSLDAVLSGPKYRALSQIASLSSVLRDYTVVRESKYYFFERPSPQKNSSKSMPLRFIGTALCSFTLWSLRNHWQPWTWNPHPATHWNHRASTPTKIYYINRTILWLVQVCL